MVNVDSSLFFRHLWFGVCEVFLAIVLFETDDSFVCCPSLAAFWHYIKLCGLDGQENSFINLSDTEFY